METIWSYLDNMFFHLPKTTEVLRAKEDLAEMMEDKYNELIAEGRMQNEAIGIVISEFGNIQELLDELEISDESDEKQSAKSAFEGNGQGNENIANKHSAMAGQEANGQTTKESFDKESFDKTSFDEKSFDETEFVKSGFQTENQADMRRVSELEGDEYLFAAKQSAGNLACGVFLCICSPVLLIILSGGQEFFRVISEGAVIGVGLTVLLCMVACAVGLFIISAMKMEPYEYLKKECFTLDPVYEQTLRNIWESRKKILTLKITAGVILCILSVVPLIITAMLHDFLTIISVGILLVIVGIAVFLFITAGMEDTSYMVILQEKEFSRKRKNGKKIEDIIAAVYWPFMVIAYLFWSFKSGAWNITWIIWPFSGIIFDVICKIIDFAGQESKL